MSTGLLRTIDWGTEQDDLTVTVFFVPAGQTRDGYTSDGFTAYERAQFEKVFERIENVTNLTFVTSTNPFADFQLVLDTNEVQFLPPDDQFLGYFYPPEEFNAGIGVFNGNFWDREAGGDLRMGGAGFATILHEVMHGLGLAHPHDRGGISTKMQGVTRAFDDLGDFDLNQGIFTAMTYNGGHVVGRAPPGHGRYGFEAGPMALDIALLQEKYGANTTFQAGDTTFDLPGVNAGGTMWRAIWDTGGDDLMRYEGDLDAVIDLRAATLLEEVGGGGYASYARGISGGFTIANGVVIENATSGAGDDWLRGNDAANTLRAGEGADTLNGGAGDDRLYAGRQNDAVSGAKGADRLWGGKGDDALQGGTGADTLWGEGGRDSLTGGNGADMLDGGGGDDRLDGGNDTDTLDGQGGDDRLWGRDRVDLLRGRKGEDVLYGGGADDTLLGGNGDDRLIGGRGADKLSGQGGADVFVWNDIRDSTAGQTDRITDFQTGRDLLDLDAIDADVTLAGNQAFAFIGTNAFSAAGQIRIESAGGTLRVLADHDGDGIADFVLELAGLATLSASDILL